MSGPLTGVRIIEVAEVISGPLAVMALADQGADVIKVEPPGYGDEVRQLVNYRNGMSAIFANCNHGKRSIGVNLKDPEGLAVVMDLIAGADVFVQNWRPGTAGRLGLDEDSVRAVNPDIIYATITGFGDDGPYADQRGYDPLFQSLTGWVDAQINPEIPFHDLVRNSAVDKATALAVAQGITAALFARERGSGGQHVKLAMLDEALNFFWTDGMIRKTFVGDGVSNYVVPGERYQLTNTADGQLTIWMSSSSQTRAALRAIGRDDLADDPSQRGPASLTDESLEARGKALAEGFAAMTTEDLYKKLVEHEVPVARVNTLDDVLTDPQLVHNEAIAQGEHEAYGMYRRARPAAKFSVTPNEDTPAAALFAAHTDEVLAEIGFDQEKIDALKASGAVI